MIDQSRYYIAGAFAAGVVVTIALQQYQKRGSEESTNHLLKQQRDVILNLSKINDLDVLKKSLAGIESLVGRQNEQVKEGIEGCIGNTPLIKIKSLSEATGCEIFAKAEVGYARNFYHI